MNSALACNPLSSSFIEFRPEEEEKEEGRIFLEDKVDVAASRERRKDAQQKKKKEEENKEIGDERGKDPSRLYVDVVERPTHPVPLTVPERLDGLVRQPAVPQLRHLRQQLLGRARAARNSGGGVQEV